MKIKLSIIFFLLSLSHFAFGQNKTYTREQIDKIVKGINENPSLTSYIIDVTTKAKYDYNEKDSITTFKLKGNSVLINRCKECILTIDGHPPKVLLAADSEAYSISVYFDGTTPIYVEHREQQSPAKKYYGNTDVRTTIHTNKYNLYLLNWKDKKYEYWGFNNQTLQYEIEDELRDYYIQPTLKDIEQLIKFK